MVATEVVSLPLQVAFDPNDRVSDNAKALTEGYKIISSSPGFIESWYAGVVENDKELQMFLSTCTLPFSSGSPPSI